MLELPDMGSEEGGIAKDVKDILGSRDEKSLALTNLDAINIGFAPKTYDNNE